MKPRDPWLRISSYHQSLLEDIRTLLGSGSLSEEPRGERTYYRLELTGRERITEVLKTLLPHLRVKRARAEKWVSQAESIGEVFASIL